MELRHLEAFVAVAEERNFTRAAARLYTAQSGLSATIRILEHELDADLFVRTTRRVDLTAAGQALLPEARRTLAAASAAVDAVNSVEGLRRGTLDVGFMQTSGLFDVAGLLARYRSAYPAIQIRMRQASSADLGTMLIEGALDVIFTSLIDEPPPEAMSLPLVTSPLVIVGHLDDMVSAGDSIDLARAPQHHVIGFPPGWGIRTLVDRAMSAAGLEPRVDLEVNDTATLLDLVEAGLGIAIIPAAVTQLRPGLVTTAISDGTWHWVIAAQTIAPESRNPAGRAMWDMLKNDGR